MEDATDATISENIKRGHLQAAIWLSALLVDPPDVDIRLYGWNFEPDSFLLVSIVWTARYGSRS